MPFVLGLRAAGLRETAKRGARGIRLSRTSRNLDDTGDDSVISSANVTRFEKCQFRDNCRTN